MVGQNIGPFEIEAELGSGAMGTVYRARYVQDDDEDKIVALKIIALGLLGNESSLARFEREAGILKQLKHPNIVRLFATGKWRKTPFFAMEYVDGESLDRVMHRRDRFTWQEVITVGKQLCDALRHAHEKGIIHRDLKPSNLMVTGDGVIKLTDFGIAKDVDVTALTGANNTIGTAAYMSPEQCRGERNLTAKSDLYSMGVLFFELLSGNKPFAGESSVEVFMMHVNDPAPRVRNQPGCMDVPQGLDTLIHQLMEKKPELRPRDAARVKEALEEIEERELTRAGRGEEVARARMIDSVEMAPMTAADREAAKTIRAAGRRKKVRKKDVPVYRRGWFVATGAVCIFAAMAFIVWWLLRPDSPADLMAQVKNATTPEAKIEAAKKYLAVYGNKNDPKLQADTEWVRQAFWDARVQQREKVLLNRHRKELLRDTVEQGDDPDAYKLTMAAFTAEDDGDVRRARTGWKALADEYTSQSAEDKALWGHIAAKRLADLQKVDENWKRVERIVATLDTDAAVPTDDDNLAKAVEAERYRRFGDQDRARDRWERVARDLKNKPDSRNWYLLAGQKVRELPVRNLSIEDRRKLINERLSTAEANLAKSKENNDRVLARDARQTGREVIDLYGADADYKNEVRRAKAVADDAKTLISPGS